MNIICTQENLKQGLLTAGRIISPNNTLPILNNILLKTENGLLNISSTNLEVAVSTHIRCKIEEEGGVTVFGKTITELINNLPNKNITLQSKDNQLDIKTENYHTSLKTLPIDEFPIIPEIEEREKITVLAQDLKNSINQVVFAASLNQTQPEISGILLSIEDKTVTIAATDRYRLAEKKIVLNKSYESQQVIVPQKTILELSRVIGSSLENVEILISSNQVSFYINNTQIISRLIDGQYPDYKQIIPEEFLTTIHTKRQDFISSLKAGAIFSQGNNSVKFDYSAEKQILTVTSEASDLGKSQVDLPSEVTGGSGELLLNHKYVLDCLNSIDAENIIIKIINDSAPSIILPDKGSDYMYLVMPIKT